LLLTADPTGLESVAGLLGKPILIIRPSKPRSRPRWISSACAAGLIATALAGCAKGSSDSQGVNCAASSLEPNVATDTGTARVFSPDPILASGQDALSPTSLQLDSFAKGVTLERLGGHGVLEGKYVDVRNGLGCDGWFGAFDAQNAFAYPHSDARFQEAMSYYWGDQYRSSLDKAGYLQPSLPVHVLAHCSKEDNAFFMRGKDSGGNRVELVCLGDSVATPGASYADDATVTVHELQHATTTDTYSFSENLNSFWYDEAGSLNEAVSDFMALVFEEPLVSPTFDPRVFSRWALGTFIPHHAGTRGAHKCPAYDPTYPSCTGFPAFSATNNTISYVYPDGMGWPYANNFQGPGYARDAFSTYKGQEEIHNAGILLTGALWDVYEAIKANHSGNQAEAQSLSTKLVMESISHLPKPTSSSGSPVSYRGLATQLVTYAP
jgi:hypothetical protein